MTVEAAPRWRRTIAIVAILAFALAIVLVVLYVPGWYRVETDDAAIDGHVVTVVSKLAAYVRTVPVEDNAEIVPGQLLVALDPRDFRNAADAAAAALSGARASLTNIDAQIIEQKATIEQRSAAVAGDNSALTFAEQELERYGSLAHTGFGTTERWQQAQSDIGQRHADVKRDQAALDAAQAHVAVLETQRLQAQAEISGQQAALAQAKLDLGYTSIVAEQPGSIANRQVDAGDFVQPGQSLLSVVPDTLYVTANIKETKLSEVRPGQRVSIHVDAYPRLRLRGHVDSIQRGTGSRFALLPPENATGNFVKVVQRVPVKIIIDDPDDADTKLSPGMSVEVSIEVAHPPRWLWFLQLPSPL